MKKVITVTDLGPGDGGKGGVVHKLAVEKNAHTIIKVGGAQGSHGVRTSRGEYFCFSQFGCGSFEGVRTHISKNMLVEPMGLIAEGQSLQFSWGLRDIFDKMTIHTDALCITPFHRIVSRLREFARKDDPKGTVGIGAGEALRDSQIHPELSIRVKDISRADLVDLLQSVQEQKRKDVSDIIENPDLLWEKDRSEALSLIDGLLNSSFVQLIADAFRSLIKLVQVVDTDYVYENILSPDGVVVVESSHGILTDKYYGFHPHTTQLRTVPQISTLELLDECGYDGQIIKLGITRAYQIRHGAGPMVTATEGFTDRLLPGSTKPSNRFQGTAMTGPLDLVALRYAIEVCGGTHFFDGLAITWFDQVTALGSWQVCNEYVGTEESPFFVSPKRIKVRRGEDEDQLEHQRKLGEQLKNCKPVVTSLSVSGLDNGALRTTCFDVLKDHLGVPTKMMSFGPTEMDKLCF